MAKNYKRWLCKESLKEGIENPFPNVQFSYSLNLEASLHSYHSILFSFFRRTICELSFQTKIRRNFGASIVLVPAKFEKLMMNQNESSRHQEIRCEISRKLDEFSLH